MAITINGEPLPEAAIEFEYRRLLKFYGQHMSPEALKEHTDTLRTTATEQAIGAKLLIEETKRLDLKVPGEQVDKRIDSMIEQIGGQAAFEARLAEQNITKDELHKNIEEGCKVDTLVEKISEEAAEPTEKEMQAHFDTNKEQYVQPERASAQHILIKPASDADEDRVTAESRVEELRDQIQNGANFATLAEAHSECPSGKQAGGSLGWFSPGMMVPEFDNAVFSMEVGELSEVIETQFGFHIIYKTGADEGGEPSFAEAEPKIREFMRHARRGELISAHVKELREKAVIEGL